MSSRYLDLANEALKERKQTGACRTLNGHRVVRVVWETDKAVVFEDEQGRFWRYMHEYGRAWRIIVGGLL